MNGNEYLRQTLEYYRQQRLKKLDEIRPIDAMIRHLEKELGESPSLNGGENAEFPAMPTIEMGEMFQQSPPSQGLRPDEFYGMSQNDAAKAYLKKVGRAVSLDQLVDSLNKGGAQVGGANPKKTLYVSLMRNPMREFVSPSENYIGLRSFYPNLPKVSKPKSTRGKRTKGQKRKARSAKPKAEPKAAAKQPAADVKRENIGAVVREVMRDGQARTKEDIFKEVEIKLGHPIAPIAVYGTLRGKGFTADENGKISLVQ
jgi:hypothetical protein